MSKPFYNQVLDPMPPRQGGGTWWKLALFAVAFALLFNGCVQSAQYEDQYTYEESN